MTILGIDYGRKKIGLALSEGILAEPLTVVRKERSVSRIKEICKNQGVTKIVMGLPDSGLVEEIKLFAQKLSGMTGLTVTFQDEVLTSQSAVVKMIEAGRNRKFRRQKEDAVAAALILESYLEKTNV